MKHIIEAENITKSFSNHKALNNVNIKIPKGCIYGLLGPNGAGKTTFIRLINQISQPDSGTIRFNDELLTDDSVIKIGYLPEERGLYKKMKVGEQAMYLAQLKGMNKKEAKEKLTRWFEKFELMDWWNNRVEDLSKGMAQKVQFIVTVVHEPELLILDEPFSGFDPINTELIKKEIIDLKNQGTTIIFSTHNMQSVEEICDHITLINQSEIIVEGSIGEVKQKFSKNEFEIHFLGNMISFSTALWTGFELLDQQEINKGEFIVSVAPIGKQKINELLGAIIGSCTVKSVKDKTATMHDIFIRAVEQANKEKKLATNDNLIADGKA